MAIEALQFIDAGILTEQFQYEKPVVENKTFSSWLTDELNDMNQKIHDSDKLVADLAVGKTDNIHHVLIELQKTKLSFQMALQVRNKLLEGYQEIMRMQV